VFVFCSFFLSQIYRDCEFLEAERIMDYSLLIGLHFRDDYFSEEMMSPNDKHFGKFLLSCNSATLKIHNNNRP
jgi:hypothetical protein